MEVRFGSRLEELAGPGILAVGPKAADAIAVGYHFDTGMDDGFWAICYSGFKQEALYVQRTVAAFERLAGLKMENARPHGGVGNFHIPASARSGRHPVAGEQAGFQDTLWGFGMRLAIRSGVLAARSLLNGGDYEARWRKELGPWLRASVVNRALYGSLGNGGYRWALHQQAGRDAREFLLDCACIWCRCAVPR